MWRSILKPRAHEPRFAGSNDESCLARASLATRVSSDDSGRPSKHHFELLYMTTEELEIGKTYLKAPAPLHRLLTDLTYYSLDVNSYTKVKETRERKDVAVKLGFDGQLLALQHGSPGVSPDNYRKRAKGPSFFAQVPEVPAVEAAHQKIRSGRSSLTCAIYKKGAAAPPNTCFHYDRQIQTQAGKVPHFSLVPTADLPVLELAAVCNVKEGSQLDPNRWQPCAYASGEPAALSTPPWPDDARVEQAVLLLEHFSDDVSQPADLRFQAVLYIYSLCDQHEYDNKDWNDFRATDDEQLMDILHRALQLMPEPAGIEQQLAYHWVQEDVEASLQGTLVTDSQQDASGLTSVLSSMHLQTNTEDEALASQAAQLRLQAQTTTEDEALASQAAQQRLQPQTTTEDVALASQAAQQRLQAQGVPRLAARGSCRAMAVLHYPGLLASDPAFMPGMVAGWPGRNLKPGWRKDTNSAVIYVEYDQFEGEKGIPKLPILYKGRQIEADCGCGEEGLLLEAEAEELSEGTVCLCADLSPLAADATAISVEIKGPEADIRGRMPLLHQKARQCSAQLVKTPRQCRNKIVTSAQVPRCRHHPEPQFKSFSATV